MSGKRIFARGTKAAAFLFAAGLVLTGCGNSPDEAQGIGAYSTVLKDEWQKRQVSGSGKSAASGPSAKAVQTALQKNDGPIILAVLDETKRTAILGQAGENGPYKTFRTASRQNLVFKYDILTGTRGLGYDLLSSNADAAISMIRGRRSGTVTRTYYHLTGENHEVPTQFTCTIAPQGSDNVATPTGRTFATTIMKETCKADGQKVRNTYWVTSSGQIPQSIQWISPEVGKVALQRLR